MSKRLDIERHNSQLQDLRKILDSMKALAYMETRRLAQFLNAQQQTVRTIENVAADFLHFFPTSATTHNHSRRAYLLIGSERGFCGDFNEALLRALPDDTNAIIIAIGQKLHASIENRANTVRLLNGAGTSDEVNAVMTSITEALTELQQEFGTFAVDAIFHSDKEAGIKHAALLPPQLRESVQRCRSNTPPRIQLAPRQLTQKLIDRYVFAALNEMLYTSLMAENSRRVQHLSSAVNHLQQKCEALKRESNALRQEEITEEIEVILLNVVSK